MCGVLDQLRVVAHGEKVRGRPAGRVCYESCFCEVQRVCVIANPKLLRRHGLHLNLSILDDSGSGNRNAVSLRTLNLSDLKHRVAQQRLHLVLVNATVVLNDTLGGVVVVDLK